MVRRTEYNDDRNDGSDDQNYIRHPVIGQTQNPNFDKRHCRPNFQRALGDFQPLGYFKEQADLYTEDALGCYYYYRKNGSPKLMFKD